MINYEASAINSNVTLLQKMNKIEKYLLDNQLGNVFVTYQTLADDRLSDSDIQELNDRVIGKGDLLIDNDGYLYVITGFNEHTVYIDFNNRIKLGDRLDQAELDLIQLMIDNTFKALNPISISDNSSITGNEPDDYHTVAIGTNINLQDGTNPIPTIRCVCIGSQLTAVHNTGDTRTNERSVLIGNDSDIHGDKTVAIGYACYGNGSESIAIGKNAVVNADGATQLGEGTNNNNNTLQFKSTKIVDQNGKLTIPNGTGGTAGQVLMKISSTENDYAWQNPPSVPNGGTTNQLLAKKSNTDGDTKWVDSVPDQLLNLNPLSISIDDISTPITGNEINKKSIAIGDNIILNGGTTPVNPWNCVAIGRNLTIKREAGDIMDNRENYIIGMNCTVNDGVGNVVIGMENEITRDEINIPSDSSVVIGYHSKALGSNIVAIGSYARTGSSGCDNAIAIGYQAKAENQNAVQIGVGTNNIQNSLQFRSTTIVDGNGKLNIPNGVNGTTGQVLTKLSNAENDYAWQTPQGGGSGSGKTFDIPMLINYTVDEAFSNIMNTPTTIVIDDQQTMQGLNLETSDPDFTDYEDKTSIYGYTYFTTGGDTKTQIVYGVIAESSTPGTYEFTGLMPLAPEITM